MPYDVVYITENRYSFSINRALGRLAVREQVKFWREPQFGHLELLHARYITHSFCRHTHDTHAIAVTG